MTTGGGGEDPQAPGTPHGGTFTAKAHVFHIDPLTKRSWIPASTQAANVNILFDGSRGVYRVISLEGNKVSPHCFDSNPGVLFTLKHVYM